MEYYLEYLRKSRHDRDFVDATIEETLSRHKAILDKYAMDHGLTVVKVYKEVASAESISARPEMQKLLEDVGTGDYAGVLVVDIDRLARGNSIDQGIIAQTFQFSGTKIITPMKTYDPNNESDEEFFEFGLFMSRREYKIINKRLIRGRNMSASEGRFMGSEPPYGYSIKKLVGQRGNTLEIVPEEAEIVRMMFQMYDDGSGLTKIAKFLNLRKIPTRQGYRWTPSGVAKLLHNPVYYGAIRWKYQILEKRIENGIIKRKRAFRDDYQVYEGMHEAIIDKELFDRIQGKTEAMIPVGAKKQCQNPLSGLMYCAECGARVERTQDNRKNGRYRCTNGICNCGSSKQDTIEEAVLQALKTWFDGYIVQIDQDLEPVDLQPLIDSVKRTEAELTKLNSQLIKAYDLVEQGVYSIEVFQERSGNIKQRIGELVEEKENLQNQIQEIQRSKDCGDELIPKVEELFASYDQMTVEEKNALLKQIVKRIEYFRQKNDLEGIPEIRVFPKF